MNKRQIGMACEKHASKYLEDSGYEIVDRNYHSRYGEIDIIATKDRNLIFVEVKARLDDSFGPPSEALTLEKIRHIKNTANFFLLQDSQKDRLYFQHDKRIDFIGITYKNGKPLINHIINISR